LALAARAAAKISAVVIFLGSAIDRSAIVANPPSAKHKRFPCAAPQIARRQQVCDKFHEVAHVVIQRIT
jgi:hypothetical protein